jgi:opacity protein-like surface antigen
MKKLLIAFAGLMFATAAQAGPYTGGSVGYLYDLEEPIYSGRLGYEFSSGGALTCGFEGELNYVRFRETTAGLRSSVDLLPLMANYRGSVSLGGPVSLYFGGGLGSAYYDASVGRLSETGWVFAAQAFGGLEFFFNENVSLLAGARYLYFDDYDARISGNNVNFPSVDDVAIEIGMTIRF